MTEQKPIKIVIEKPIDYEPEPEIRATVVVTKNEDGEVTKVEVKREMDGKMYNVPFNGQEQVAHAINDAEMVAKQLNEGDMNWKEAASWLR